MKNVKLLAILFCSVITFYACNDTATNTVKKEDPKSINEATIVNTPATPAATQTPTESAQNPQGVWHYTCAQGCAGGAGTAVNCSTCGNLLAHNQAYHSNANAPTNNSPLIQTPTADPSQNSAGVWHYTCGKGCAGGAGAAGSCANCGTTLAHNAAYHQ